MFRCLIGIALTLPATLVAQAQEKPAEVMGRTLKDWRKDLTSLDPSRRDQALAALGRFPPDQASEAIPDIILMLQRHTASNPMDVGVRERGLVTLGQFLQAKPDLDPAQVRSAMFVMRTHLKDPQAVLRSRALQALAQVGPCGQVALVEVFSLIQDKGSWEIRRDAVRLTVVLLQYESDKSLRTRGVSSLSGALNDPTAPVRMAAMEALATLVSDPEQRKEIAARIRTAAQRDSDKRVKVHALVALALLEPAMMGANVAELRKLAKDADASVRKAVLTAIAAVGPIAPPGGFRSSVITIAIELTRDTDPDIAETAIRLLAPLRATEAIPHLEKLADNTKLPARLRDAADDAIYLLRMK